MPNLHLEYLFEDDEQLDPTALPDYTTLDFVSNGYISVLWCRFGNYLITYFI